MALRCGEVVFAGEVFGEGAGAAGGEFLVVDVGGFGRSVAGNLNGGNLHVGVGQGVADGVFDYSELLAVVDHAAVACAVWGGVEHGLIDFELDFRAAFVLDDGEVGHFGGDECEGHAGGGIEVKGCAEA